nr:RNA-directed DNA polymerase, eukaryota [Tanacetum cinerariifolium]
MYSDPLNTACRSSDIELESEFSYLIFVLNLYPSSEQTLLINLPSVTDYYFGITSITVNGKNAYELKGKFLDDLHNNALNGANKEDAVEHIKYFLKIVDPIDLPNIDPDVVTKDNEGFKTYEEYKDDWIYEWNKDIPWVDEKPWTNDGEGKQSKSVKHYCKPFNYKTGCSKCPTCSSKEDGYCNGGNLPGAYIVGNSLHYQDLEWYDALEDSELKEEALRNKAIMKGMIVDDDESNEEKCESFDNHKLPVCTIRIFKMIKYSFGKDKEYVAVNENEYDVFTYTSEDACRAYQEIFCMMDGGGKHKTYINAPSKDNGFMDKRNSFAQAVKGGSMYGNMECDSIPAIVLDDECLYSKDVTNSLMVRVKDFFSLSNLKIALTNKGFDDINIRYMGELWVMLEFASCKSKDLFHSNVRAGSWFSVLQKAEYDFMVEGRIVYVEVEDIDDQEESCFHLRRLCIYTKSHSNIFDSFKIAFRGKVYWIRAKEVPVWIPKIIEVSNDDEQSVEDVKGGDTVVHEVGNHEEDSDVDEVPETMFDESSGQKKKQSEDPFGIYPLLDKQRKVNSHGDTMNGKSLKYPLGFTPIDATEMMEQSTKNVEKQNGDRNQNNNVEEPLNRRDDCSDNMGTKPDEDSGCSGRFKKSVAPCTGGSILCLMEEVVKETKMESMELITIKSCWGNYAFDYVHSDAVGNSGGILCVWDTNEFCKRNSTVSDYFVIVRGVWVKTRANLLIVAVYAPHDLKDKCLLWDYLTHVSNHWDEEVMMIGDFNEVRFKSDKFGSFFNERGADMFNSFISNASLEEVPLGGCAYTWCYKSASKMSKLDRVVPGDQSNGMHNMLFKLKFLKSKIREWINVFKNNSKAELIRFKREIQAVDGDIDNGNGSDEVVSKRKEIINSMLRLNKIKASEAAQKDKIKWSVEGDENLSFFHGMLNKNRNQLSIQGVMADGVWIENPDLVKDEFVQHFRSRFGKPTDIRAGIDMNFPKDLSSVQKEELECDVSKEELKRVVWYCGMDKSPGPDGFTFRFFRKFWSTIENDVYEAVTYFFTNGVIPKGCNSSFIALISKTPGANMVKDFRPISLIGSMYKIIAKILTNRLVGVIGDIVNEVQSAFIADRQILDGLFILNEGGKMCRVKEWDEVVDKVVSRSMKILRYSRFSNADRVQNISHSIYVTNFPDSATSRDLWNACSVYGTLVDVFIPLKKSNEGKRFAFVRFVKVHNLVRLVENLCTIWIGRHHLRKMSRVKEWNEVVDKVVSRLSKWKMKTLSIGGILTLLKSVLGSILIFHMSIYRVPSRVLQRLESICNRFFNGNDLGSKKATWIKWSNVLADKAKGGLGVSSLYALNRGLMIKWLWRFYAQNTSLWVRVVKAIHGEDGKMGQNISSRSYSCWLNIVKEDNWINGGFLKDVFPRLYALEMCKKVYVSLKLKDLSLETSFCRKVVDLLVIGDFLLISLIGCQYKIIAKIIANQLCYVVTSVVGNIQMAYIKGRQIIEGPLLVEEIIAWTKKVLQAKGVNVMKYVRLKLGNRESTSFWEDNWINGGFLKDVFPHLYALEMCKKVYVILKLKDLSLETSFCRRYIWSLEGSGDFSVASIRKVNILAWKVKMDALLVRFNLSRRVTSVVGNVQMAYIKGRQIIEGPLMVEEIIAWTKKGVCLEDNKVSWIGWDKVIEPCDRGGLNIGSLRTCNQVMLTKWWWRFGTDNQAL